MEKVNLSLGGEVELSYNFANTGFYCIPTLAAKWSFLVAVFSYVIDILPLSFRSYAGMTGVFLFFTVGGDHINPQIHVSEMVCPKT